MEAAALGRVAGQPVPRQGTLLAVHGATRCCLARAQLPPPQLLEAEGSSCARPPPGHTTCWCEHQDAATLPSVALAAHAAQKSRSALAHQQQQPVAPTCDAALKHRLLALALRGRQRELLELLLHLCCRPRAAGRHGLRQWAGAGGASGGVGRRRGSGLRSVARRRAPWRSGTPRDTARAYATLSAPTTHRR